MNWDRTGEIIRGVYLDKHRYLGKIISSRVKYGGRVQHTVELFEPITVFGEQRTRLLIDQENA